MPTKQGVSLTSVSQADTRMDGELDGLVPADVQHVSW